VFLAENLLREARRQKSLPTVSVPRICVLDPDGDIVRFLRRSERAAQHSGWACYHTKLHTFEWDGLTLGVIGCAVGGSFAVLVAEELFASGCELLISVTSAGQIVPVRQPPYYVLIDRALRDEGTSYHYLAPGPYAHLSTAFGELIDSLLQESPVALVRGASWTTDAPFRETEKSIGHCREEGILAVEMEAASLYAFAEARGKPVICFAHITNRMACIEGDFEKGEAEGAVGSMRLISVIARQWRERCSSVGPGTRQARENGAFA
jgi:uridine phosphorylase